MPAFTKAAAITSCMSAKRILAILSLSPFRRLGTLVFHVDRDFSAVYFVEAGIFILPLGY